MVIAADTSFLFSLYGNDSKTPDAVKWSSENTLEIIVTILNRFELINALRFAECWRFIPLGKSADFAADFELDLRDGRLVERSCSLSEIMAEAFRLSQAHKLTSSPADIGVSTSFTSRRRK